MLWTDKLLFPRFESIICNKAILSRAKQLSTLGKIHGLDGIDFNGGYYISICNPGIDNKHESFIRYVSKSLSFILDKSVLDELQVRSDKSGYRLSGEIQIKDSIPSEYFVGVGLGGTLLERPNIKTTIRIMENTNCNLPVFNMDKMY